MRGAERSFSLLLIFFLVGCSTAYESTAVKSWNLVADGNYEKAIDSYQSEVKEPRDQLLVLMDSGIIYRQAGDFEKSNEMFFAADKILAANGYFSVAEQTASLFSNQRMTTYQGEDFEKVLVHLYLALNFVSLKKTESALVEARRVNEILYQMISKHKRPYTQIAFAHYLMGYIFESAGEWNDAFIAYKHAFKIAEEPKWDFLGRDLLRNAMRLSFFQEIEELQKHFGEKLVKEVRANLEGKLSSAVLFFEAGKSPEKISTQEKHQRRNGQGSLIDVMVPVAVFERRPYQIRQARLCLTPVASSGKPICTTSEEVMSIEDTAISHLRDRMSRQIAKALLSAGIKTGIAVGVGKATDSDALGVLTALALFASSQADTRSWLMLPASLQVARCDLKPGKYVVRAEFWGRGDEKLEEKEFGEFLFKPNSVLSFQTRAFY